MSWKPRTKKQRTRTQKLLRDGVLLLFVLLVCYVLLDFPMPTAGLAFCATERRYFFTPGELVLDLPGEEMPNQNTHHNTFRGDRAFVSRRDNLYAFTTVFGDRLFWYSGELMTMEHTGNLPLTPLRPDPHLSGWSGQWLLVVSTLPEVTNVEVIYPCNTGGWRLNTDRDLASNDGCFFIPLQDIWQGQHGAAELRLKGYADDGTLIYESPLPAPWQEEYHLSAP